MGGSGRRRAVTRPGAFQESVVSALSGARASGRERVTVPPSICLHCGVQGRWHNYRYVPEAPAVGCGACGFVVFLTAPYYDAAND